VVALTSRQLSLSLLRAFLMSVYQDICDLNKREF
jgi:hypothetical protein